MSERDSNSCFHLAGRSPAASASGLPAIAAYEQAIKASHVFNLLQARGVISVQERASYMGQVRDLAKGACAAWIERMTPEWQARYPEWTA